MQPLAEADLHSTVLVQDGPDSPGAFLVAHALRLALGGAAGPTGTAASRRVVLLAAAQAAGHYTAVLRKAGLNLAALVAADRLAVVDLLPLVASAAPGPPPSLSALHQRLAVAVAGSGGGSGGGGLAGSICLVVDDLTALRCLATGAADWTAFLQACVALGAAPGCCFVGLAHGGVPDDDAWLARLEHSAALVLQVEPLESGASADTTGRVVVTRRNAAAATAAAAAAAAAGDGRSAGEGGGAPGTRLLTYKLGDAGATYVAVQ